MLWINELRDRERIAIRKPDPAHLERGAGNRPFVLPAGSAKFLELGVERSGASPPGQKALVCGQGRILGDPPRRAAGDADGGGGSPAARATRRLIRRRAGEDSRWHGGIAAVCSSHERRGHDRRHPRDRPVVHAGSRGRRRRPGHRPRARAHRGRGRPAPERARAELDRGRGAFAPQPHNGPPPDAAHVPTRPVEPRRPRSSARRRCRRRWS